MKNTAGYSKILNQLKFAGYELKFVRIIMKFEKAVNNNFNAQFLKPYQGTRKFLRDDD